MRSGGEDNLEKLKVDKRRREEDSPRTLVDSREEGEMANLEKVRVSMERH